jgi:hypothetical protein
MRLTMPRQHMSKLMPQKRMKRTLHLPRNTVLPTATPPRCTLRRIPHRF